MKDELSEINRTLGSSRRLESRFERFRKISIPLYSIPQVCRRGFHRARA